MPFRHHNKVFVICDKLEFKFPEWRWATVHASNCIFGKSSQLFATRGQILRLKCTKFYFGAGGAYCAPPDPLAGFKRPTSKGREGREGKGKEVGEERKGKGREREGRKCKVPPPTFE